MSSKKPSEPLTKNFLVEQLQSLEKRFDGKLGSLEKRFDEKLDQQQKSLEAEIKFSRQDAKEHLEAVASGLNTKIESVEEKIESVERRLSQDMHVLELRIASVYDNVKWVREDVVKIDGRLGVIEQKLDSVSEKVEKHDTDIAQLKSAAL